MQTSSNFAGRAFAAVTALVLSVATIAGTVSVPSNAKTVQTAKVSAAYIGDVA